MAAAPAQQKWHERFMVPLVFVFFVLMRAMDRVFYNRVCKLVTGYVFIVFNIYWPICIQIITILMTITYVYAQRASGDTNISFAFLLPGYAFACKTGQFSVVKMAFFSFWDQLNVAIGNASTVVLPQTMQSILTNSTIIFTAIVGWFYLGSRFHAVHYIGMMLIIMSGLWDITVEIQGGSLGESQGLTSGTYLFYVIMFVVSYLPNGISNCYKQKQLKDFGLDVMYATYMSGYWQIFWGFLMMPSFWIPMPAPFQAGKPSQLGADWSATWECMMGNNPYNHASRSMADATQCPGYNMTAGACPATNALCQSCASDFGCVSDTGGAYIWFLIYLFFNASFNLLMLWLTKRMSAMWASIATTVCLDLTNIFTQFPFIAGKSAAIMTFEQWMATVLATVALSVYNIEPETNVKGENIFEAHLEETESEQKKDGLLA